MYPFMHGERGYFYKWGRQNTLNNKKVEQTIMALEEEIRILRQDVEYIKGALAELVEDSVLTSEEEEMVRRVTEAVRRGDLSGFIKAEEL